MPIYSYTAKDPQGEYHRGDIETVGESQAAAMLRRKGLIVVSLKGKEQNEQKLLDKFFYRISFSEVVMVTRQLATMVEAGLVLSEAIDILEDQQTNLRFKKVLKDISSDVKGGLDFASALEKHPDVFPDIYSKLVRAGQASGKLDVVLNELATNLEKQREFQGRVKNAMIYPIVVVTMMVGVMLIMIFFVIPKMMGLYAESGIELPLPTKIMLGITGFMINFWWALLAAIIVGIIFFRRYVSTPNGRLNVDRLILKSPILGKIVSQVILTNFTRTFGLLISSGLSILEAIKILSQITGNRVYQDALETTYQGVERGLTFSGQLLGLPVFPKIVGQMAKTGEETGKLDSIMLKLAEYFESEADNSLKNITTLIEPIVLVILGIGVGFLVVSIIMPIYQLTTNIK